MMSTFGCCGVVDYRDFESSSGWVNSRGNHTIPEACCRLKDVKNIIPEDDSCVTNPTEGNSFFMKVSLIMIYMVYMGSLYGILQMHIDRSFIVC